MNLTCETILDYYEHKNKKILCQIKVKSSKGLTTKNTCRSLTPDQWSVYDKKLEKLINTTTDWNDGKCLKFNISPCICVEVQKSKLSAKTFHICLDSSSGTGNDKQGDIERDFVLECIFDFQQHVPSSSSIDSQEYVPMESSPEGKQSSSLAYEPYTPSKRQNRAYSFNGIISSSIDILESTEDTYSPKPLYEIAEVDPLITEDIPQYIPAPIESISTNLNYKPRNENNPPVKSKSLKSNLTDSLESEYIPTSQDNRCEVGKDNNLSKKYKSLKSNLNDKLENEYIPTIQNITSETKDEHNPSKKYKSLKSNLNDKLEIEYIPTSKEFALTDVPVYIPTPIDNTQPKVLKTNIRKHKRRSKTIDEYPLEFLECTKDKYKTLQEEIEKLKEESKTYERRFSIKRSKTIDEMPTALKFNTEITNLKHYHPGTGDSISKELKSLNKPEKTKSNSYPNESISTTKSNLNPAENKQPSFASELETANKLHKNSNQKTSNKTNKDTSQQKIVKENTADTNTCLRRSDRSLSKPKRFIEEQPNLLKKHKEKSKTSPKTRELFGTDDEDDDETAIELTDNESQSFNPPLDSSLENSLTYEPYTPTKKKYRVDNIDTVKTPGIDFLKTQKDTFSPESLSEIAKDDSTVSEEIPNTPLSLRITTRLSSRESSKSSRSDLLNEVIIETGDEIDSSQKDKTSKIKPKEKEEIKHSDNKPNEENRRRKHRKRSKTVDEIPILSKEKTSIHKDDKYKNIKELEEDGSKHSHYEHKKLKKRSQSTEELPKLKKIIREESKIRPLETISENKLKNKKKASSENISESKTNEKSNENSFSSSDDYLEIAHLQYDKKESKTRAKISDDEFEDSNKLNKNIQLKESNDNNSNLNISISSATTESATDTSPSKGKRGRKPKENISSSITTPLRRSERSPSKPLRYIEMETIEPSKKKKLKKHKISPTNKDLFGSDNDDDFENNNDVKTSKDKNKLKSSPSVFETPVSKKINKSASSSSSSSTKKKRKRDRSSECEQEKRDMSKWLSKKKSTSTDKEKSSTKDHKSKSSSSSSSSSRPLPLKNSKKDKKEKSDEKTDSRSNSPTPVFEMPSKEELDLIRKKTEITQKENAKLRAELEKMTTAPPKEVEFLSLQKMTVDEILDTFSTYKTDLDEIYENNRRRDYIKGHDGINHCFIIRLLQQNVQMKMLEKLTEVYSNTKTSAQATLFANALLPEWVIRVFMKKFKFTRKEAMDQIKAQEEFQLHMEEQSDNSFMFD